MHLSNYAELVLKADNLRNNELRKALQGYTSESSGRDYGQWARALKEVNDHITVRQEYIDEAAQAYEALAIAVRATLRWPDDAISVIPQGSASTRTLIRAPDASNFDIDAVCAVNISQIQIQSPTSFFNTIGDALAKVLGEENQPQPGKRCWRIPYPGRPFYLEFTPSVPLGSLSQNLYETLQPRYRSAHQYWNTGLAVVDTPTESWKTSNPAGFSSWVNDTAKRNLLQLAVNETGALARSAGVTQVPDQSVDLADTLRVAIRLFKRHRDMCALREYIDGNYRPISIIIVTLLTGCYQGLADLGRTYKHPIELLLDLAELMPQMVSSDAQGFRIDNPTVIGENFAERWNDLDGGNARQVAFNRWCTLLHADLRSILAEQEEIAIRKKTKEVFGCAHATTSPNEPKQKLGPKPAPPVTQTAGLA